jgi:hypothetical protein
MAQTVSRTGGQLRLELAAANVGVVIPATGSTNVLTVPVYGMTNLGVQVVVGVHALDGFAISARFHRDADFVTLYSSAGSFTTPAGLLIGASGDLTAQAVGTGWFILDVRGLYEVRVSASGTVDDTTTISLYAGGA